MCKQRTINQEIQRFLLAYQMTLDSAKIGHKQNFYLVGDKGLQLILSNKISQVESN